MNFIEPTITAPEMSAVFSRALHEKALLCPGATAIIFYNLRAIQSRVLALQQLFPEHTQHAVAVKANPLIKVLSELKTYGAGAEVASLPELHLAQTAGFAPGTIVFDSPCKTTAEIEYALRTGVYLNADTFDELNRIAAIRHRLHSDSRVGLRINPQVGPGNISATSVAGPVSKFGIPIHGNSDKIRACFQKFAWLSGIHVHIGSQGCPVPLLISGIRKVLDLALEINHSLALHSYENHIETFDIGGGLPVSYHPGIEPMPMEEYVIALKESCPELFSDAFRLITEFGRYIFANTGWVASKVEYVKRAPDQNIVITHVGADLFLRKCYNPADWHHHITVADKNGKLKSGTDINKYMIAGPLCFAGDVIARDLALPEVTEGDYLLIHDAGAYTLSMWSRYNSRQMPLVLGYRDFDENFEILRRRETPDDLVRFWS